MDPEIPVGGRGEQKLKAEESIQSHDSSPAPHSLQITDLFLKRCSGPQYNSAMLWGSSDPQQSQAINKPQPTSSGDHPILNRAKRSTSLNPPARFQCLILKYAQKKGITRYSEKAPKIKRGAQNK